MDKNKSRTDMLAAGRKKLQQYRKKKNDKGGKTSSKDGKSEQHVNADKPPASININEVKLPVPGGEGSGCDITGELVDSSALNSRGNFVTCESVQVTNDLLSAPVFAGTSKVQTELQTIAKFTSYSSNEQHVDSSAQYKIKSNCDAKTGSAKESSTEVWEMVNPEGMHKHVIVPASVHLCAPHDLGRDIAAVEDEIEVECFHGVDQEVESSGLEQIDRSSMMELEGDRGHNIFGGDGTAEANSVTTLSSIYMDSTLSKSEHISKVNIVSVVEGETTGFEDIPKANRKLGSALSRTHGVSGSVGSTADISDIQKADEHSDAPKFLPLSDESTEAIGGPGREDSVMVSPIGENSQTPIPAWDSGNYHAEGGHMLDEMANMERSFISKDNGLSSSLAGKMICWADGSLVSLSQLAAVVKGLDKDDYSFLCLERESSNRNATGLSVPEFNFYGVLETLTEQLYVTNFVKDMFHLQLTEQLKIHTQVELQRCQLVNEISVLSVSLTEAQQKTECFANELERCVSELKESVSEREDYRKKLHLVNAELEEISTRSDDLQTKLDMSYQELKNTFTELAECRCSVAALQVENENLSRNLTSVMEDRDKYGVENFKFLVENHILAKTLVECESSLQLLSVDNAKSIENVALMAKEKLKLEQEKDTYVCENRKLLTDLAYYKGLVESLQVEKENLNDILTSFSEERRIIEEEKVYFIQETEKLTTDLMRCKGLVETPQMEISTEYGKAQALFPEMHSVKQENLSDGDSTKASFPELARPFYKVTAKSPSLDLLKLNVYDDNDSFMLAALRGHLEGAGEVLQKLEKSIAEIYSHSVSSSRSSDKVIAPAISKLIQAFESKSNADEHESEGFSPTENQSHADSYLSTNEQIGHLRTLLKELGLDAENASELLKGERNGKILADLAFKELKVHHDALWEDCYNLEEANIELVVLYEIVRQHVCNVEAKKGELFLLYETLRQEDIIVKADNTELGNKLNACTTKINVLQRELDELHQNSNEMISLSNTRMEILQKEVSDRALILHQEWNSVVSWLSSAVQDLDKLIGIVPLNHSTDAQNDLDVGTHVAASFEAATKMIFDLQDNLHSARRDHELTCSSYMELNDKFNNLNGQYELATGLLHKICANLRELVNDSYGYVEESEANIPSQELLDPVHAVYCDTLLEQLRKLLDERLSLKSLNLQLNSDLINKINSIEELNGRHPGVILKLVEHVKSVVNLEGVEINMDEPASSLESLIYFLVQSYKEANDIAILSGKDNGGRELKLNELQEQLDHLIFMFVHCENENISFKGSLKSVMEDLVAARAQILGKVSELEQSEQRVCSLREKLSIAVAKGKGLIAQRDSLKQSLAEKSSELERCLQDLSLKDARLLEVETKLKAYSEAGERVEALESELSYIRNSATALRESFLLKDSVIQRIEEILENLELPEHFHAKDTLDKIDWLARSVTGNLLPPSDWDQKSVVAGRLSMEAWKELPPNQESEDELLKKYDDLQSKFYGLAEQNEMLEQSLMERNNLVQRWEEILDKINMPSQLRSMEPEDRIEWLGGALSEAVLRCESLQQKIESCETFCRSLSVDLEESQRRILDLEADLLSVSNEKDHLCASLEILTHDNGKVSEREKIVKIQNHNLQNEVSALKDNLEAVGVMEEQIRHVDGEIRRMQVLLSDILGDYDAGEQDLGTTGIECLEHLIRKLINKYLNLSSVGEVPVLAVDERTTEKSSATLGEQVLAETVYAGKQDVSVMMKELEESRGNLNCVEEERDKHIEDYQTLVHEFEKVEIQKLELQELLNQEEQKSASVREKLNLAVRKGKSLVQQRDSMKQTIDELTTEVERLKYELNIREKALLEFEQKIEDLNSYKEKLEDVESKCLSLQNCLSDRESDLKDKRHTINVICGALGEINVGTEYNAVDPVQKIVLIGKVCHDLRVAVTSSEQESNKSRRAAELLLAELNEVQERNDGLQEELAKADLELSELKKERDLAEAAKHDALSHLGNLNAVLSEERNKQFADYTALNSYLDQLRKAFFDYRRLLGDALAKDLEFVHNLEANIKSLLKSSDDANMVREGLGDACSVIVSTISKTGNPIHEELFALNFVSDTGTQKQFDNDSLNEILRVAECHLRGVLTEIGALEEKLFKHSSSLHEESIRISEIVSSIHTEVGSRNQFFETMKQNMSRLESIEREKDMEIMVIQRSISLLYDACKSSVSEIKKWKSQLVEKATIFQDQGFNMESPNFVNGRDLFSVQTMSASEGFVCVMADELLLAVKGIVGSKTEIVEIRQMELKSEISNLQTELQDKVIEKERTCMELVNQVKEAESTATRYLQELQRAKDRMLDLERTLDIKEEEHSILQNRVEESSRFQHKLEELQDREASYIEMQVRVRSLIDVVAAKEQEIEALMQALEEEEVQMEDLKYKIEELENNLQKKSLDLVNAEASLGKASKKLSITVSKFDELHFLSESLLTEVEKLQSQLHDRDSEISFLRQEVTRCTNDVLVASQMSRNKNFDEISELVSWLDSIISRVQVYNVYSDDAELKQDHGNKEVLQKQIMSVISKLENLQAGTQDRDNLLLEERSRVEELTHKVESLEKALCEKGSQFTILEGMENSGEGTSMLSETTEIKTLLQTSKWSAPGPTIAPQVRSLRKSNNDQVAISVDMDSGSGRNLVDEDDDKAHGFKSLATSAPIPKFTRPVTNVIDGLWVSCDRALMRQPALRLGVIIYWVMLHALLATFAV